MEDANPPASNAPGIKDVVRDVIMLWVLTALGGFFVGFFGRQAGWGIMAVAVSNLIMGTIGFTISGCLVGGQRWPHLLKVMLIVWLTGLINLHFGVTLIQWVLSVIALGLVMLVGGGISYLFRK